MGGGVVGNGCSSEGLLDDEDRYETRGVSAARRIWFDASRCLAAGSWLVDCSCVTHSDYLSRLGQDWRCSSRSGGFRASVSSIFCGVLEAAFAVTKPTSRGTAWCPV